MTFKYDGIHKDWYEDTTYTFLSTYYSERRGMRIVVVNNSTGKITEFDSHELKRVTKLEEALK